MNPLNKYLSSLSANTPSYGGLLSPNTNYGGLFSGLKAPSVTSVQKAPTTPTTQSPAAVTPTAPVKPAQNTTPTPAISSSISPEKNQYLGSLSTSSDSTPSYLQPGYRSPGQIADDLAKQNGTPTTSVLPATPQSDDPMSSYAQYLKTFQDKANAANSSLADIQTKKELAQTEARRGYDEALDAPGGLKSGAQMSASVLDRRNNSTLADIALQESAAARTAGVAEAALGNAKPLQIGDNYYDPSTGKLIPNKAIASNGAGSGDSSSTSYIAGNNPTVDSWVQNINSGKAKLSDITGNPTLKSQVSQGLAGSSSSSSTILDTTKQSLKELQDMVDNNQGFDAAVGIPDIVAHPLNWLEAVTTGSQGSQIAGSSAANFDAKIKQVVNDVVLPNLTLLHGLGRVTDREFQALQSSLTSLSPNLSESQFKTELKNITDRINVLSTASSGSSTPNSTTNGSAFAEQW